MQTALNLLTRDGAFFMRFRPALTPAQYEALYKEVKNGSTREELRQVIVEWAKQQGIEVSFDE